MTELVNSPLGGKQIDAALASTETGNPNAAGATDGADAMGREIAEVRNAMRAAIDEARPKTEIVQIFIRASDISDRAAGSEVLHKKKDTEGHAAFREIGPRVDLLRAQSLTDLEKAGRRFMGRHGEGIRVGTPPHPSLLTLCDLFPNHSQNQARKLSHDIQSLAKLSPEAFEALVADPDAPRPRSGPEKRVLPLSEIRADERAQPRAALDMDRVAEYVEAMGRGEKFPPLVLFQDKKGRYWLADGFHRFHAAVELKRKTIECTVYQGELRDAILFSCSANSAHGLPRTSADKRTVVTRLLADPEWGNWSNVEISKRCRVSDEFVRKLRQQLEPVTSNIGSENERTYTDKHGNTATMRTGNIGGKPKPGEPEASGAEQTLPAGNDTPDDVVLGGEGSGPLPAPTTALPKPTQAPKPTPSTPMQPDMFKTTPPLNPTPAPQSQQALDDQEKWLVEFEKLANSTFASTWNTDFPGWWEFNRPGHFIKMAENASEAWASVASKLKEQANERAA